MKNEYSPILRIARWLRRIRKRRGYGVHSPFAFDFITGVVYNDETYYAYEYLRQPLIASISRLDEYDPASGLTAKDLRLLFRITNWTEPYSIHLWGASPIISDYIFAARPSATTAAPAPSPTLTYINHPLQMLHSPQPGTIIIRGIHNDWASRRLWKELKATDLCTVSFDLGRFGVIVTHPKIPRQHYIVNYF